MIIASPDGSSRPKPGGFSAAPTASPSRLYLAWPIVGVYLVAVNLADIINPAFFPQQGNGLLWLLTVGGIVLLLVGADRAVSAAVRLAKAMGISTVIIGATVVSLGTTSPEAAVSVMAAFRGNPGLALGNGVGSIICDTAMIFGLCCCITRLPIDRYVLQRHGRIQLGVGLLLAGVVALCALAAGGVEGVVIPRWVGVIFLGLLVGYMLMSFRWAKTHPEIIPPEARAERAGKSAGAILLAGAVLAGGLGMVIFGSDVLIGSLEVLAGRYGVPDHILAVTLVAFGTSLPELATALAAIIKGHPELLVGNIVGADILNVLFVIGASSAASELAVPSLFVYLHLPVMLLALLLLRGFVMTSRERFSRWQGVPLLLLYVAYVIVLLTIAPRV